MKVGDLVRYNVSTGSEGWLSEPPTPDDPDALGLGIVLSFDEDGDPLIHFFLDKTPTAGGDAFFSYNVEIISESG